MAARRGVRHRWSRSGLPTVCGVKLPDGRECLKRAGPFGACEGHVDPASRPRVPATLDPLCFGEWYRTWLRERGREPVVPDDLQRFVGWWRTFPTIDKMPVPWSMNLYQVKNWWMVWCRLTGHPVLIPFDMTLFCDWWRVT